MYTGSYTSALSGNGTVIFCGIALLLAMITYLILPIIMAVKFNCSNKKLIIILHIALFFILLPLKLSLINTIISLILIYLNKRNSRYYEDTGKNIAFIQSGLYALSILVLFMPMVKIRMGEEINGLSSFNIINFGNLFSEAGYKSGCIAVGFMIGFLILGLILNLIFRDARKLLPINMCIQGINAIMMFVFASAFYDMFTTPGIAFIFEAIIIIASAVILYIITSKVSYIDN